MVEREHERLIQDVLDGVATPEEVARLDAWLSRDPAARARYRELEELFEALKRVPLLEAPSDLRHRVLRALPPGAPGVRTVAPRSFSGLHVRLAYVFAAGLMAGVFGAAALTGLWKAGGPAGGLPVGGSMMPSPATPAPAGATTHTWSAGRIRVDGTSWRVGSSRFAAFRLEGGEAEIEVLLDPAGPSPIAFRQASPQSGRFGVEPARVVIQGRDRGEYLVEFVESRNASPPLRVTVRAGGQAAAGELPAPQPSPAGR